MGRMKAAPADVRHPLRDKLYLTFVAGWYSTNDPTARSRCCHLGCNYTSNIIANLVGGTFWSGLLLLLNADDSFIGTASMIGTAANMLQLFAPLILERFPRRRTMLTVLRAIMYLINILLIGLIPLFPLTQQGKLTMLAISILVVNLIAAFIGPGLNIWHIQSIPDRVRKNYFSLITMTTSFVVALFNLLGSRVVDWLKNYGMEYEGLLALRIFALALATIEIILYFHIDEHPYEKADSPFTLKDVFVLPLRSKSYLLNVACIMLWNFAVAIPGSYHSIYMLRDVGVSYSYVMAVSLCCTVVSFLVAPLWKKLLSRMSWFKLIGLCIPFYLVSYVGFAFTAKSTVYIYAIASLIGSVCGVGVSLGFSGIPYYKIPPQHSTIYIAFYSTMASCASLLGVTLGKYFMLGTEGHKINVLGMTMVNNQYLLLLSSAMLAVAAIGANVIARIRAREAVEEES